VASRPGNHYRGVALLGWMESDQAAQFLTEECVFDPPLTASCAESLWREYRERAAGLQPREACGPRQTPLTEPDQEHAQRFLAFFKSMGIQNVQVIKVDPMQLVVAQYSIATELAEDYADRCASDAGWMKEALPTASMNPNLEVRFTRKNLDTEIDIDLPHAEFIFGVHAHGGFGPKELLNHVMVMNVGNRMLLGKGYHRLYARVSHNRSVAPHRSVLVALDPSTLVPPSSEGAGAGRASDPGLGVFGRRPALFGDYFQDGLFMPVNLRRKRFQLQVRAKWVALYDDRCAS
jgi:hypothetical protein